MWRARLVLFWSSPSIILPPPLPLADLLDAGDAGRWYGRNLLARTRFGQGVIRWHSPIDRMRCSLARAHAQQTATSHVTGAPRAFVALSSLHARFSQTSTSLHARGRKGRVRRVRGMRCLPPHAKVFTVSGPAADREPPNLSDDAAYNQDGFTSHSLTCQNHMRAQTHWRFLPAVLALSERALSLSMPTS